ncbi:Fanconi anemia group F protein [Sciurus carolinensis]|uniref:Fanconi anemia group F protein n=1 Tax=Sciurus carolinensis TaxID=30640 RepID=UPI001FB3CFA0|nr:Fanconi anemia group F protein [Sciurus carolinensis]
MDPLLQHLERFSEVLAVSRTPHVSTWDQATVRRALQWARYLRHVYQRFCNHESIRTTLERRLHSLRKEGGLGAGPVPELTNFEALAHCDILLSLRLLKNPALGNAACHYLLQQLFPGQGVPDADGETLQDGLASLARRGSAVHMLRFYGYRENPNLQEDSLMKTQAELLLERLQEVGKAEAGDPGKFLCSLWERLPQKNFLKVVAVALLEPPLSPRSQGEELELGSPQILREGSQELVHWLLGKSEIMGAFCRNVPAGLLTLVAGRHPVLSHAYLSVLTDWSRHLYYDLQKGVWVGAESQDVPWQELYTRFQSLCQAPPPLKDEVLTALKSYKAQDGDFEVPGLSIWTDLLLALQSSA